MVNGRTLRGDPGGCGDRGDRGDRGVTKPIEGTHVTECDRGDGEKTEVSSLLLR